MIERKNLKMQNNIQSSTGKEFENIKIERGASMNQDISNKINNDNRLSRFEKRFLTEFLDDSRVGSWWQKGWSFVPTKNAFTDHEYSGLNKMYLSLLSQGKDPRYATFNQAKKNGYNVEKGSTGIPIQYFSFIDSRTNREWDKSKFAEFVKTATPDEIKEELKNRRMLKKEFFVFNAENLISLESKKSFVENNPLPPYINNTMTDERILEFQKAIESNMNLKVHYESNSERAFYSPATDSITLPQEQQFHNGYEYLATYLHELTHATGHPTRLNRDLSNTFGTTGYAKEELIAEMNSVFMLAELDSDFVLDEKLEKHFAYLDSWKSIVIEDPAYMLDIIKKAVQSKEYCFEKGNYNALFLDVMEQQEFTELLEDLELIGLDQILESSLVYNLDYLESFAKNSPTLHEKLEKAKQEVFLDKNKLEAENLPKNLKEFAKQQEKNGLNVNVQGDSVGKQKNHTR